MWSLYFQSIDNNDRQLNISLEDLRTEDLEFSAIREINILNCRWKDLRWLLHEALEIGTNNRLITVSS